jgi:hypothetical protein
LKLNDVPEKSVQELKKRKLISEMFVWMNYRDFFLI